MGWISKTVTMGALALGMTAQAHALAVYGLTTTNSLVTFDSSAPTVIKSTLVVSGLNTGASLVGIDFRPATGQLFGISSDSLLYSVNIATGMATQIGAAGQFTLVGTNFGFDFNPMVDRIRVVSDADQNLRLNPNNGARADVPVNDGNLAYAGMDANAGANPNVTGSAYTNSAPGPLATTTILYGIDTNLDILVTQNPPNAGTLNTVGSLGLNAVGDVGFDIFFFNNQAFASINSGFYSINLATGAATLIGAVGGGVVLRDIAIAQIPEPETLGLLVLGVLGAALAARRRRR